MIISSLLSAVRDLPPEFATILLSAAPVGEVRLALPLAITVFHLAPAAAFAYAFLGNILPLIFVYLFLPPLLGLARRHSPSLDRFFTRYLLALEHRHRGKYDRYGRIALLLFVAIPLPGSGVWTASILAIIFGIEKAYSIPAILVGLALASLLVLLITQGSLGVFNFFLP